MSVAILLPVLDRPAKIAPLLANIRDATPEPHAVWFAASDRATIREVLLARVAGLHEDGLLIDEGRAYSQRINLLYRTTDDAYVFLGADDYRFHPGWLTAALDCMARSFDDVGGVVVTNDLHNPAGTACLVARCYIDEVGGSDIPGQVLHPGYSHNWCDSELFGWASSRGRLAHCPESIVEHLHPAAGKGLDDDTYRLGLSSEARDRALFRSRHWMWGGS